MNKLEFTNQILNIDDSLQKLAYYLTSNDEDAKDLIQETYLKALSYRDLFRENTNIKAWTITIMKNTFINDYRKKGRYKTIPNEINDIFFLDILNKKKVATPLDEYSVSELEISINNLNRNLKEPFFLHLEGFKYKEIAERLDLKIGTVKSRIHLARQRLIQSLKEYLN